MTNPDYTIFTQRIERAAVRYIDADMEFARLCRSGVAEDHADKASGLSAASDAVMDIANAACDTGNAILAVTAAMRVLEAGLSFPIDRVTRLIRAT